jgi:PASTA domain
MHIALPSRRPLRAVTALLAGLALAGLAPAGTAAATCQAWDGTPPPSAGSSPEIGLAVVSACDVWVVGGLQTNPLFMEHWTGSGQWTVVHSPSGPSAAMLEGADAVSASDVWAVGSQRTASGNNATLTEHWDGNTWHTVPSPSPSTSDAFIGVSAISATSAWAVGEAGPFGPDGPNALAEQWNGTNWVRQPVPIVGLASQLQDVSMLPDGTAWAVGLYVTPTEEHRSLAEFWTGSRWVQAPVPTQGQAEDQLHAVTALSPTNVWAVGTQTVQDSSTQLPLIEHFDGLRWTQVTAPPVAAGSALRAIAAVSATDIWAAGEQPDFRDAPPLLLHYDGQNWTAARAPGFLADYGSLMKLSTSADGSVWLAIPTFSGDGSHIHVAPLEGQVSVPAVTGSTPAAAQAALPPAELAMGGMTDTTSCGPVANGMVASTTPAADSNVDIGTPVMLNVCNTATTVPNVLGFDDTSARNAIAAAGLIASVTMTANCTASRGTVLTQNPQGGTAATRGDTVRLTESTGKQPNGKPCIIE